MEAGGQATPLGAERDVDLGRALLEVDIARDTVGILGPDPAYKAANGYVAAILAVVRIARSGATIPKEVEAELARASSRFVAATRETLAGRR